MSDYAPSPILTDHVVLPDELVGLTEKLAQNTHDQWARQRLADGWRYGDKRDDSAKTHPSLVPYGELPDSEKAYDRITAMETLKAIMAMGFKIKGP